jgi:hypothetical protein
MTEKEKVELLESLITDYGLAETSYQNPKCDFYEFCFTKCKYSICNFKADFKKIKEHLEANK